MITKSDIEKLYIWGKKTNFPLRNEVITSKYMGYGLKICHLKIGKKRKMVSGMTFEFGRGRNHSVNDVANMFGDYPIEYGEDKPGEAETTLCDYMMATDVLGWSPTRNLKDYLEEKING